jgi:hypothetical protein
LAFINLVKQTAADAGISPFVIVKADGTTLETGDVYNGLKDGTIERVYLMAKDPEDTSIKSEEATVTQSGITPLPGPKSPLGSGASTPKDQHATTPQMTGSLLYSSLLGSAPVPSSEKPKVAAPSEVREARQTKPQPPKVPVKANPPAKQPKPQPVKDKKGKKGNASTDESKGDSLDRALNLAYSRRYEALGYEVNRALAESDTMLNLAHGNFIQLFHPMVNLNKTPPDPKLVNDRCLSVPLLKEDIKHDLCAFCKEKVYKHAVSKSVPKTFSATGDGPMAYQNVKDAILNLVPHLEELGHSGVMPAHELMFLGGLAALWGYAEK